MAEPNDGSVSGSGASEEAGPPPLWRDGRSAFGLVFQSPLVFFILCGLTFLGSLVVLAGTRGLYSLTLVNPPEARLWHVISAIEPALWMAAALGLFNDFKRNGAVWPGTRRERLAVLLCALVVIPLLALPALVQLSAQLPFTPAVLEALLEVPHLDVKGLIFNAIGTMVGGMAACGMLGVHVQLIGCVRRYRSLPGELAPGELEADVLRYQHFRSLVKRTLGFSAAIISSALLNIGSFRNLLNAAFPSQAGMFPATANMGFGIYYTGILASIYLPISMSLSQWGQALADRLVRHPRGRNDSWKEWSDERQAVRTYLGLEGSGLQDLQQGLAVLAPFLTAISTLLFSSGK